MYIYDTYMYIYTIYIFFLIYINAKWIMTSSWRVQCPVCVRAYINSWLRGN